MQDRLSVRFASLLSRGAELVARGTEMVAERVTRDKVLYSACLGLALLIGAGVWFLGPFHRPELAAGAAPSSVGVGVEPATQPGKTAQPTFSFQDDRPLSAAAADTAGSAPSASADQAAPQPPATVAASFSDTRPLPDADVKASQAIPTKNGAAPQFNDARALAATSFEDGRLAKPTTFADTRPVAGPSFSDERLIDTPAFNDERPVAQPSFSDDRTVQSLSFSDERTIGTASFSDQRPVAAPSFSDARPLAVETSPATQTLPASVAPAASEVSAVSMPAATKLEGPAPATVSEPQSQPPPATAAAPSEPVKVANLPTLVAISPSAIRLDAASPCKETEITTEPLDGGQMRIRIAAGCHPGEAVQISYGGAEFIRKLNTWGALDFVLDCFAGSATAAEVRLADGSRKTLPIVAHDLDKVSKIAVVWRAATNLDLHVFEYGSRDGEPGHIWVKSPSSIGSAIIQAQADKRGHGALSVTDDGEALGDKVEVYTFVHNDEQTSGAISMALDYESRGERPAGATCGSGALAEVDFQVNILPRNGQVSRQAGVLTRVDCGSIIPPEARFNQSALPVLRIKR